MTGRGVLAIGLDGYSPEIGDELIGRGRLPNLAALKARSARFLLDHGDAKFTGLAWEHFSTGLTPEQAGCWGAVEFDPRTYAAVQRTTTHRPFLAGTKASTVVFDVPYFDLARCPGARGMVNWGSHDPGIARTSRPAELAGEIEERFGAYPADEHIYDLVWPDPQRAAQAGSDLAGAVDARAAITHWLLTERLAEWDLAVMVVSEFHSVIEPCWHAFDPAHPLHRHPSAAPARASVEAVYQAADRLIGTLVDALPDARLAVFALHGMGGNDADVPAMVLLPELLHRASFERGLLAASARWDPSEAAVPALAPGESWEDAVNACIAAVPEGVSDGASSAAGMWRRFGAGAAGLARRASGRVRGAPLSVEWMPAMRYRPYWPRMRAFALPAYYDGRVRLNVAGRERAGMIARSEYGRACDEIEHFLRQCRDPRTGQPMVGEVIRTSPGDPGGVANSQGDLDIRWLGYPFAAEHPDVGLVGPVPFRRLGGHTGSHGIAYIDGPLFEGDHGWRSTFDVMPTLLDLAGAAVPAFLSGTSLLGQARRAA
jgi:predicted AlkP superfamily phosphohydrolase/phosphomutase